MTLAWGKVFFLSQVRKISAYYGHFLIPTFLNYDCSKEFLTARKMAVSRSDSESEQVCIGNLLILPVNILISKFDLISEAHTFLLG